MGCRAVLVLIPALGVGLLVSTVEVAKLLVDMDDGLSVAVLVMMLTWNPALKAIIDSVSASSSIAHTLFIQQPEPELRSPAGST